MAAGNTNQTTQGQITNVFVLYCTKQIVPPLIPVKVLLHGMY